jgi:hypothetical protein
MGMIKYSIWIEGDNYKGAKKSLCIYHDADEKRTTPLMQFVLHDNDGVIALSNGALLEYHLKKESFGILIAPNARTHIYRDGDAYAIMCEDKLEWVVAVKDDEAYVWLKRD